MGLPYTRGVVALGEFGHVPVQCTLSGLPTLQDFSAPHWLINPHPIVLSHISFMLISGLLATKNQSWSLFVCFILINMLKALLGFVGYFPYVVNIVKIM